jgi:DNA-directed RNA polymerase specialized sigma24 family protein
MRSGNNSPLLDEAMAQLRDQDRDALVLRYFQNKSLRDVGAALGLDEYAAQKRVGRALEKLRVRFARRGLAIQPRSPFGAISANSVQAAPALLAKS